MRVCAQSHETKSRELEVITPDPRRLAQPPLRAPQGGHQRPRQEEKVAIISSFHRCPDREGQKHRKLVGFVEGAEQKNPA